MEYTIALAEDHAAEPRKITKIVPYDEGGIAVLVPYHSAKRGWLLKHQTDYTQREMRFARGDAVEYTAEDRVKLSIHPDGFVQFSGENPGRIVSGRDPSGGPKGLGIVANPWDQPIISGPTFGLTIRGLAHFEPVDQAEGKQLTLFGENDYYYRRCTPDSWNSYLIEGFVFPNDYWGGVRKQEGRFVLTLAYPRFEAANAVLEFRVLPLPGQPVFLGIMASRFITGMPRSGFSLHSPSDRKADESVGTALMAIYPAPPEIEGIRKLDYPIL